MTWSDNVVKTMSGIYRDLTNKLKPHRGKRIALQI